MKTLLKWYNDTVYKLGSNHYWFRLLYTLICYAWNWGTVPFRLFLFYVLDLLSSAIYSLATTKEYFLNTTYSYEGFKVRMIEIRTPK